MLSQVYYYIESGSWEKIPRPESLSFGERSEKEKEKEGLRLNGFPIAETEGLGLLPAFGNENHKY